MVCNFDIWPVVIEGRSERKKDPLSLSGSRKLSLLGQNWQSVSGGHLRVAQLLSLYLDYSSIISIRN